MKIIILAAGRGSRLHHLTSNQPKSLVKINGKSLIDYQLTRFIKNNCKKIYISTGYKSYSFHNLPFKKIYNRKHNSTNMVYTLINTLRRIKHDEDIIISYGDILFNDKIFKKIINNQDMMSVVIDEDFINLWEKRINNPIDDLETLKIKNNLIIEIGNKPKDISSIQGQYLGLIKINKKFIKKLIYFFDNFKKINPKYKKDINKISMTNFINELIKNQYNITPIKIKKGWFEIDSELDLKKYVYYNLLKLYKI